jgi:hypothetical protein
VLEEISKQLREETLTPGRLSELKLKLAGEYAFISDRLADIQKIYPQTWLALREKTSSDKQADRKWELSKDGYQKTIYKQQLKSIEKLISAIGTRISVLDGESRNQY